MLIFILFISLFSINSRAEAPSPISLESVSKICWIDDENIYVINGKTIDKDGFTEYDKPIRERIFHYNLKSNRLTPVYNLGFEKAETCLISPDGKYICSYNAQKDKFTIHKEGKKLYQNDDFIKYLNKKTVKDERVIGRIELLKIYKNKVIILTSIPFREVNYYAGEEDSPYKYVNIIVFNLQRNVIENVFDLSFIIYHGSIWTYSNSDRWLDLSPAMLDLVIFYSLDKNKVIYKEIHIPGRILRSPFITKKYVYYSPEISTESSVAYPLFRVNRVTLKKELLSKDIPGFLGGDKYLLLIMGKGEKTDYRLIRNKDGKEILKERMNKLNNNYGYSFSFSPNEKNLLAYDREKGKFIVINIEK